VSPSLKSLVWIAVCALLTNPNAADMTASMRKPRPAGVRHRSRKPSPPRSAT
jgi:hypothetical protein